eukprot:scaffold31597_cov112-Isochrysis_galbana.AAC.3
MGEVRRSRLLRRSTISSPHHSSYSGCLAPPKIPEIESGTRTCVLVTVNLWKACSGVYHISPRWDHGHDPRDPRDPRAIHA